MFFPAIRMESVVFFIFVIASIVEISIIVLLIDMRERIELIETSDMRRRAGSGTSNRRLKSTPTEHSISNDNSDKKLVPEGAQMIDGKTGETVTVIESKDNNRVQVKDNEGKSNIVMSKN